MLQRTRFIVFVGLAAACQRAAPPDQALTEIRALRAEMKALRSQIAQNTTDWQLAVAQDGRIFLLEASLVLLFESTRDAKSGELVLRRINTRDISALESKAKPGRKWDWRLTVGPNGMPFLHDASSGDTFYGARSAATSEIELHRVNTTSPVLKALADLVRDEEPTKASKPVAEPIRPASSTTQ